MPAPQQQSISPYGDTYDARNRTNAMQYGMADARDQPGYALANLLGVIPKAAETYRKNENAQPSTMESEQMSAMATMGLDEQAAKDRLKLAGGKSFLGLMKDPDTSIDSYQLNRGNREAILYAGKIRDAYNEAGLAENDDPAAFAAFQQKIRDDIFNGPLKDADPSFQYGFLKAISPTFGDMAVSHAGNVDKFATSRTKMAAQELADQKANLDYAAIKEQTSGNLLLDSVARGESGGNYNAMASHSGNKDIDFTGMTIADVLNWQDSGQWRRYGNASSAVGRYQFIQKTLAAAARAAGIDPATTKFTPAVQDKLAMTLMSKAYRGANNKYTIENFLDGNITAEELVDNTISREWAAVKTTAGRGRYDGDGKNGASIPARQVVQALVEYRKDYRNDPSAASIASNRKAGLVIGNDPGSYSDQAAQNAPTEIGVSTPEFRQNVANSFIKMMEADPTKADEPHMDDLVAGAKLNEEDRQRVVKARDRIRQENRHSALLQQQAADNQLVSSADEFIRSGDKTVLAGIKTASPDVYGKLLEVSANPPKVDNPREAEKLFLQQTGDDDPKFKLKALQAYTSGQIDAESYIKVTKQYELKQGSKDILHLPGVENFVETMASGLPVADRRTFMDTLATAMSDLKEQNGGKRPPIGDILAQIQTIYATTTQSVTQQRAQLANQYSTKGS